MHHDFRAGLRLEASGFRLAASGSCLQVRVFRVVAPAAPSDRRKGEANAHPNPVDEIGVSEG